jgi:ribosomal protein S18 acetylase RimI-like enzyme
MIDLETALEAFVHSFAFTRAIVRPSEAKKIGAFWCVRDVESTRKDVRSDEWTVPADSDVPEVLRAVDSTTKQRSHRLCIAGSDNEELAAMKRMLTDAGYRFLRAEPIMVIETCAAKSALQRHEVIRVQSTTHIDELNAAARSRQILPAHLTDNPPSVRAYYSVQDGAVAGFVRCVTRHPAATYVAGVETFVPFRRTGVATDLMNAMLADDCKLGVSYAVLMASRVGERLYNSLGFALLGYLQVYSPRSRSIKV